MIFFAATKRIFRILWIGLLLVSVSFYLMYGEYLTGPAIKEWLDKNTTAVFTVYCLISVIRGLTLIPATPFIFAGVLLFPQSPELLFIITLSCIILSSTLIYYASGAGFSDYFEKKYPLKIEVMRKKLSRPQGFYFIAGWALLPFTPTDLLVYVGGSIRMPFYKIMFPLMIGETVICAVYIFNGVELINQIRSIY